MPINRAGGRLGSGLGPVGGPWDRFGRNTPFRSKNFSTRNAMITGVTKDSAGAALGGATVQLFRTLDDAFRSEVVSDGSGNYVLYPDVTGPFYLVAYKAGAPDVTGVSVNTVLPNA
jgi:hypothetical protein